MDGVDGDLGWGSGQELATRWLQEFESAINQTDLEALARLFSEQTCSWRDVLTFTWDLQTYDGHQEVMSAWADALSAWRFGPLRIEDRLSCEYSESYNLPAVQVAFGFRSAIGRGRGVVRLTPQDGRPEAGKAWSLLTALEAVNESEERIGINRPRYPEGSRVFGGPNWLDHRIAANRYNDRDPQVLIVGGGQAGLSLGARLKQLGVDALIIDKHERPGDNWRKRYHALQLHNEVCANHLPYIDFPCSWPVYVPKDMLASWFEGYVENMELNFWSKHELISGEYDEAGQRWEVVVRGLGDIPRVLRPRHVVMATGVSGIPHMPVMPGIDRFCGPVIHSSEYVDASQYTGKRVLVVGTGNSGHDIAQDLHNGGADVTIMQRGSTTIVSLEPSAQMWYAAYSDEKDTESTDLFTLSVAYPILKHMAINLTAEARELDQKLLERLDAVGFRTDSGEDGTGWQMKYYRRGGGYYINVGCSELIADKRIALCQYDTIDGFVENGLLLSDGSELRFDACIMATGYKDMQAGVRATFGDDIAARVGPVWGLDEQGELRNVWKRTPQNGLWFMMGSFTQCRIFSRFLALQIWAAEVGFLDRSEYARLATMASPNG